MTRPIRLIAIDLDGTLLNSKVELSQANRDALRRAHAAGIEIVLGTGRRHDFALPIALSLGFDLWLFSSNGAITRSTRGETFHRDMLPKETAIRLAGAMRAYRNYMVLTFDRSGAGAIVCENHDQLYGVIQRWMEKNAPFIQYVSPLEEALTEDPIQAMFCGPIPLMAEAQAEMEALGIRHEFHALRTQYDHRNLCIVDILNAGCSKGHALERWAAYRGIGRSEVMAIGDNYNDVEMLTFAGHPVIMGNACDELKQSGWTVTLHHDEHGVAATIGQVLESNAALLNA
ncbi:MAG TPA: Cof-type HAD-IIB family hydrolase [Candidatus Eisenbacteria bacterium]|nr:Cof-type HAD-IIB family hydrolase [Candidatus Eisenbacteria bacterium]